MAVFEEQQREMGCSQEHWLPGLPLSLLSYITQASFLGLSLIFIK